MESVRHGLRPLALAFSVPHALAIYAALFLLSGLAMETIWGEMSDPASTSLGTMVSCLPLLGILPILAWF